MTGTIAARRTHARLRWLAVCLAAGLSAGPAAAQPPARRPATPVIRPAVTPRPHAPDTASAVAAADAPSRFAAGAVGGITGTVFDSYGVPVAGADVHVPGSGLQARSGLDGRFVLWNVPSGPLMVAARRVGYFPASRTLMLGPGETQLLELTLAEVSARPFDLQRVVVTAALPRMRSTYLHGFYERMSKFSGGTFFTLEDIQKRGPTNLTDLFRGMTGISELTSRNGSRSLVVARGGTARACPIRLFVDGISVPMRGMSLDDVVNVNDVQGIEIYRGMSTIPGEFSGLSGTGEDSQCGVIVVWTRVIR